MASGEVAMTEDPFDSGTRWASIPFPDQHSCAVDLQAEGDSEFLTHSVIS